nr:MAG TPA: hypothetical protein [Caudoviricetes sp.]
MGTTNEPTGATMSLSIVATPHLIIYCIAVQELRLVLPFRTA